MSRATLRAAMVTTFGGGAVTGLTDVHPTQKKVTSANEWYKNDGDHYGALGFVHIERELEARRSFAGPSAGYKKISYDVGLVIHFRHNGVDPSDTVDAATDAINAYDALLENIKETVRGNRTLSGAVFQIGEGDTLNGDDVEVVSDLPTTDDDDGYIFIWAVVRFKVIEFTAP